MIQLPKFHVRIAAEIALCAAAVVVVFANTNKLLFTEHTGVAQEAAAVTALHLSDSQLQAEAAIVYDPTTGEVLFDKHGEEQFPLASLTKIMSADAALDLLSATSSVPITPVAMQTGGDYSGLHAGEIWKAGPLIKYTLLVSANDGMAAVAQALGTTTLIEKMNADAKRLGLSQSYFLNTTGLDLTQGVSGAYGSARDVALLTADFYHRYPSYMESTVDPDQPLGHSDDDMRSHATTKQLLDIPGLIGAKTGYTDLAGGNLAAVFDVSLGHPLIAVVLHSSEEGRYSDIRTLIEAARAASQASAQ